MTPTAFPKPSEASGRVSLTPKARRALLGQMYAKQLGRCASCGNWMTREPGVMHTATLGHRRPEPMGCKKDDRPENIIGAICWACNTKQGSKRV